MNLTTFDFNEVPVRVLLRDAQPWFVAADVCRVLELTNPTMACEGMRPGRSTRKDLIDQDDARCLLWTIVTINSLLCKLPETKKLDAAGRRACDKACDARNALRVLLAEHEPLGMAQTPAEAGTTNPATEPAEAGGGRGV